MENTTLTPQQETKLREIITEYKDVPGALLPVLEKAQEACGYLPMEALEIIADGLGLPLSKVAGTAGFYPLLKQRKIREVRHPHVQERTLSCQRSSGRDKAHTQKCREE